MSNDENLQLAQEKLHDLEKALIIETKPDIIFELKQKISELKQLIIKLSSEINPSDKKEELKSIFYVPRTKNEYFTGRKEILEQIYDKLHQNQVVALNQKASIAVHGLGGMGKTQTLIEYAYRCQEMYQTVLWLSTDSKETFESGFQTLAIELKLPVEGKPFEEIRKSVENWLIEHKNWLLLIDNADELELIKIFLAKIKGKGQILISTRAQNTRLFAEPLALEKMNEKEALTFLEKRTGLAIDQYAINLVQLLDYLPLALDQAAAYICATQMPFEDYLDIYQSDRMDLLNDRGELLEKTDHPDPVAKTWNISFEKVQEKSDLAIEILRQCAFLSPDGIMEEIFEKIPKKAFNEALKEILKYSLLTRDSQQHLLIMHRLVQEILRAQLSQEQQIDIATTTVKLVVDACPNDETDFTAWLNHRNKWLLNAQSLQLWINTFHLQFKEVGTLFNQMGYFLYKIGNYEQVLPLVEKSVRIFVKVLGEQHPSYAQSLNNLAYLYDSMGAYEKALLLYEESLKIKKEILGTQHPSYAQSLNNLAGLYDDMGEYEKALPLYEESLKIDEKIYGRNHPEVAIDLNNLAELYRKKGNYKKALPLHEESLKIRKEILGIQHPSYAQSLNNLAYLYDSMGEYEKALPLYEESARIFVKVLGEQHPHTQNVKRNYEGCFNSLPSSAW